LGQSMRAYENSFRRARVGKLTQGTLAA